MTTDWNALRAYFTASPYYFTENMKECFVYDNPFGYSIREFMIVLDVLDKEVMDKFDKGLAKYKFNRKKGGRILK